MIETKAISSPAIKNVKNKPQNTTIYNSSVTANVDYLVLTLGASGDRELGDRHWLVWRHSAVSFIIICKVSVKMSSFSYCFLIGICDLNEDDFEEGDDGGEGVDDLTSNIFVIFSV